MYLTKEVCHERYSNIEEQVKKIEKTTKENTEDIVDLKQVIASMEVLLNRTVDLVDKMCDAKEARQDYMFKQIISLIVAAVFGAIVGNFL